MLGGKAVEELAVELGCKARVDERGLDAVLGRPMPGTRIATGCSRWSSDQLSMDRYSSMQAGAR